MGLKTGLTAITLIGLSVTTANAALVYQNTFSAGTGVPTVTPGGGTIAVRNGADAASGTVGTGVLTPAGGVDGNGGYTTNSSYAFAGGSSLASTGNPGGSSIAGLPASFGQFTISFWVRTTGTANDGTGSNDPVSDQFGRQVILGAAGIGDQGANAVGLAFRRDQVDINVNNNARPSVGAVLAPNVWNFIAFSYDGTSVSAFNSAAQNTATGFASSVNGQLYEGTDTASVTRYAAALNTAADAFTANAGPVALGSLAALLIGNRTDLNRGTNGGFDDVRIYDTILTPAEIEGIRVSVPEPASLGLLAVGGFAVLRRRRV